MSARAHVLLPSLSRGLVLLVSAVLAVALLALVAPAPKAQAAELPGSIIDGGYIISDAEFFNAKAMSEAQIQTFLNSKVSHCNTGKACVKNYRGDIAARASDGYCKAVSAEKNVSAARIIWRAATACGINPKVLLVMLQKEQGLITSASPSDWGYEHALGFACPDTPTGCEARYAGFSTQVYLGARQLQLYTKHPTWYGYRAGQYNTIKWAPSAACGTSKVYIKNQATANLYNYTPYRPNIAALAAGWGTGDSCSTYGNRNFYNYYVAWFAPGASSAKGAPAQIAACTAPAEADIATVRRTASVTPLSLNARQAPTTLCGSGIRAFAKGTKVTVTGTYGAWSRVSVASRTSWVMSSYLKTDAAPAPAALPCTQPAASSITKASGTVVVTTASLNARTAPSTACNTGRTTLKQGQTFTRTGTDGAWWRLTVSGKQMWAHSDYLALKTAAPAPKPAPKPTVKPAPKPAPTSTAKTTVALNLRSSASLKAKILTVLPRNASVTVVKKSGSWSQVKYGSRTGWVANTYLTTASTSAKPAAKASSAAKTTVALNLRSSASLKAKILTVLPRGASVTVVKKSGSWSQVKYGSRTGWVANTYLTTPSTSSKPAAKASSTVKKTTVALNLRSSGSLKAKILYVLPRGAKVTVVKKSGSWSQVKYGSRTGWVANTYLR